MKETKLDRRVVRTRRALREALLSLILEKGYDAVTIEDITERADLGRTTFYLHYRDKEDLLLESIAALTEELRKEVVMASLQQWNLIGGDQAPILEVFRHAAENATLYRIILQGQGATKTASLLSSIIADAVLEFIDMRSKQVKRKFHPQVPLNVFAHYFAGSMLGLLTWWLEQDMPYAPEEMTDMFQKMFFFGGLSVLGVEPGSLQQDQID